MCSNVYILSKYCYTLSTFLDFYSETFTKVFLLCYIINELNFQNHDFIQVWPSIFYVKFQLQIAKWNVKLKEYPHH